MGFYVQAMVQTVLNSRWRNAFRGQVNKRPMFYTDLSSICLYKNIENMAG